ncbi:hypothetical protein OG512_15065 [Streptomyces sp. NBC_01378]
MSSRGASGVHREDRAQLPADGATAAALDRLNGRTPGALRAVNG